MSIRAISLGGGVQSTALLVLAEEIGATLAIFADTGDEHPATLRYIEEYTKPFAESHGIELVTVAHPNETLPERVLRQRGITIPVWKADGAPLGVRGCTRDFKLRPIAKELKRRGATATDPAIVALGISLDEFSRMRTDSGIAWETLTYPLIDRRMDRSACVELIKRAGLPVPPKSACVGCPYSSLSRRKWQHRHEPEVFAQAVAYEAAINAKQQAQGGQVIYLTPVGRSLPDAVGENTQLDLFDDGPSCDIGGYCMS